VNCEKPSPSLHFRCDGGAAARRPQLAIFIQLTLSSQVGVSFTVPAIQ
jgi:hypothetical protein